MFSLLILIDFYSLYSFFFFFFFFFLLRKEKKIYRRNPIMFVIIMDYLFDLLVPDSEEIKFYKAMKETEKKIIKSKIIGYTLADARKRVWPIIIEPYTQCTDKMMTNRCIVEVRDSKISKILVIG